MTDNTTDNPRTSELNKIINRIVQVHTQDLVETVVATCNELPIPQMKSRALLGTITGLIATYVLKQQRKKDPTRDEFDLTFKQHILVLTQFIELLGQEDPKILYLLEAAYDDLKDSIQFSIENHID